MDNSYFLAVCKDRPNDPNGFWYTVYFMNNTANEIEKLSYETGGFATFDDELIETSKHQKELGRVPAFSAVEIEKDDEGSFDFVIYFHFDLKYQGDREEAINFTIDKYLGGGKKTEEQIPILNKVGYVFRRG